MRLAINTGCPRSLRVKSLRPLRWFPGYRVPLCIRPLPRFRVIVSTAQVGPAQVGPAQDGTVSFIAASQVSIVQVNSAQVGPAQVSTDCFPSQVYATQEGPA